jgi:hypothetical protein
VVSCSATDDPWLLSRNDYYAGIKPVGDSSAEKGQAPQ